VWKYVRQFHSLFSHQRGASRQAASNSPASCELVHQFSLSLSHLIVVQVSNILKVVIISLASNCCWRAKLLVSRNCQRVELIDELSVPLYNCMDTSCCTLCWCSRIIRKYSTLYIELPVFVFSNEFIAWLASRRLASPASSISQRNRSCWTKHTKINFSVRPHAGELRTPFEQPWLAVGILWIVYQAELAVKRAEQTRIWKIVSHFPWVE